MICDRCKALEVSGYEYPESYCSVGCPEELWYENSKGECGCRMHPQTIKKRLRDNEIALQKEYEYSFELYSQFLYEDRTGEHVSDPDGKYVLQAKHCIGLDHQKPYHRHGKAYYKPYRNHYDCGPADEDVWNALVEIGYAYKKAMYHLSDAGFWWIGSVLGVKIYGEDES